jgi:hypothetical protein
MVWFQTKNSIIIPICFYTLSFQYQKASYYIKVIYPNPTYIPIYYLHHHLLYTHILPSQLKFVLLPIHMH